MNSLPYLSAIALLLTGSVPPAAAQARPSLSAELREFVAVDTSMLALVNVRVIDGTGAPAREEQTVVIRDGLIAAVGQAAAVPVPQGARVLDLRGHTVFPGIVGMHNHLGHAFNLNPRQDARLYLGAGVTTIRVTGAHQPYSEINLKREIDEGRSPGPRIHLTGPFVTGPGYRDLRMAQVSTPEEARRFVSHWADEGVTWIKVYTRIQRRELAALIEEAHERGLKVTGHLCSVTVREAAELGIDNIEHGPDNTDFDPQKQPDVCPPDSYPHPDLSSEAVASTIRALITNNVAITATLPEAEAYEPRRPAVDPRVFDLMHPNTLSAYHDLRTRVDQTAPAGYLAWQQAFFRTFVDAGGLMVAGIDAVFPQLRPGLSDQRNYELLIEAGFPPEQAIKIMTANGAKLLGIDTTVGTVETGKIADLVIIDGDPTSDTTAMRNVVLVFKGGIGYDSPKLIESVRQEVSGR